MKHAIILLALITLSFTKGDVKEKFRYFGGGYTYYWADCQKPSTDYITKELPTLRKCFNEYIANIDSIERFFHFIDFNDDKKLDVIYSGPTGAASDYVVFLLNTGKGYKILFEEYTHIREVQFENKRLTGYTGLDLGCCAEYIQKETKYQITTDWKKVAVHQRAKTSYTRPPETIYEEPLKFIVTRDIYKMRSSPEINDTGMVIYDTISNVVSAYPKGSTGYAWSEEKDSTGRIWWFVEMDYSKDQIGSRLSTPEDTLPFTSLGWMSSKYLKVVE